MTAQQPAPEAVEALGRLLPQVGAEAYLSGGQWHVAMTDVQTEEFLSVAFTFLRDAIHGDGPESDAVRDALGLWVDEATHPVWVDDGPCNGGCGLVRRQPAHRNTRLVWTGQRRVVGDWQEVER